MSYANPEAFQGNLSVEEEIHTIAEAIARIQEVKIKLSAWGNNDHEFSTLREIEDRLKREQITPTEAVAQADNLFESKVIR